MIDSEEKPLESEPSFRATVRAGRLHLTGWAAWLEESHPGGLERVDAGRGRPTIVDLTVLDAGQRELLVQVREEGLDVDAATNTIVGWAENVGYRRVWLEDAVVEIFPSAEHIGIAVGDCRTCGARWRSGDPEFWLAVREAGQFPGWCPRCGAEMPQWDVN